MAYQAKHRGASRTNTVAKRVTKTAAVTGIAAAVPMVGMAAAATPANAASTNTWERLAMCESSGNWHINTGNGFYGGLQFTRSTWTGFGGGKYASRADYATKSQQIEIAEKVLDVQGWGAWPACSAKLGLGSGDKGGSPNTRAQTQERKQHSSRSSRGTSRPKIVSRHTHTHSRHAVSGARYVVRSGDTLSTIAQAQGVDGGWRALWNLNRKLVGSNPNLIFPNEKLRLG
ncbi:LysM domain-containing protein [Actinopolymorpha cephalotaxi]|uniref:LysM domain-containing protein n=1 Tax=Actinopolymorpha cephalotaxi TaxID=504797 RepID=A0A1I2W043_9ACTN|nr:transglycosylase family protein [Actinopolymorpha cephalotaxi]NYH82815.1 nucleoid-associated protein YgaU [Actinopolymorpha cephalotaxi]SFG94818.1 LysM domain-containing protein [Actinopolymorpha cephalotaxi]